MGKDKKEKRKSEGGNGEDEKAKWEERVQFLNPISKPLASRKLTKKLYKTIKKAQKEKCLRKGVREVQKFVRKGETGIVVLAGDTSPIEIICHMPLVCEEKSIPYCYIPSKEDLGAATGSTRGTCMVLIKSNKEYKELYETVYEDVKGLPMPIS